MREINVSVRQGFRQFSTPSEAIKSARQGRLHCDAIGAGLPIVEVRWSDLVFAICVDDGRSVIISATEGTTGCLIDQTWPTLESMAEAMSLRFFDEHGDHKCSATQERGELPKILAGRDLVQIFANPPMIFVYASGLAPIMLSTLWNIDNECPLLNWGYAE